MLLTSRHVEGEVPDQATWPYVDPTLCLHAEKEKFLLHAVQFMEIHAALAWLLVRVNVDYVRETLARTVLVFVVLLL